MELRSLTQCSTGNYRGDVIDDLFPGLITLAFGAIMFVNRRGGATALARRRRFWEAKDIDVDEYEFVYGVVGCVVMIAGVILLMWRPFS
jgi:hypothetical protein